MFDGNGPVYPPGEAAIALASIAQAHATLALVEATDAKTYPNRQFYRGYEQGVRDGFDGAEHALKWLASKEKKA